MSVTIDPTPPAPGTSWLGSWVIAAEHGGALVYNEIQAIEADASKWSADNPAIAPLITAGTDAGIALLTEAGVPVPQVLAAGTMVLSWLKKTAALDPTVSIKAPPAAATDPAKATS
jgi:hypothetical protein